MTHTPDYSDHSDHPDYSDNSDNPNKNPKTLCKQLKQPT